MSRCGDRVVFGAECLMGMLNKGTARSMAGCVFGRGSKPTVPDLYALSAKALETKSVLCPSSHPS